MGRRKGTMVAVLVLAATAGTLVGLRAQVPALKRTILQRGDLSTPGYEAVMATAEFPIGGATGKHTHPGEEVTYVMDGTLTLEIQGQAPRTFHAGDAFMIEAGRPHEAKNAGSSAAKVLGTYIVKKGQPLATPVP